MKKWTVIFPLISIFFLLWIEQGIEVSYIWKTLAKVLVFVVFPVLLLRGNTFEFLQIRKTQKKSIYMHWLGLVVAGTILSAFMLLNDLIDLVALQEDLETRVGVTASVFPFVAVYILLGNSFLEEFFFRGLLVDLLRESKIEVVSAKPLFRHLPHRDFLAVVRVANFTLSSRWSLYWRLNISMDQ